MCSLLYKRADDTVFDDFPKISEGKTNVSEHFPNISEDCRRRPKEIRRCFDHTPTNLSVVEGTKEKCFQT